MTVRRELGEARAEARVERVLAAAAEWIPRYSSWRHGGWYVDNVRYASGAVGCVSRNYPDRKWRIACDPRPFDEQPTFRTRDDAARAERLLAQDSFTAQETLSQAGSRIAP